MTSKKNTWLALSLALTVPSQACAVTLNDIRQAWKDRALALDSLVLSATAVQRVHTLPSKYGLEGQDMKNQDGVNDSYAQSEFTLTYKLKGTSGNLRVENSRQLLSVAKHELIDRESLRTFNQSGKFMQLDFVDNEGPPKGIVVNRNRLWSDVQHWPFLFSVRPLDLIDLDQYSIEETDVQLNGKSCLILLSAEKRATVWLVDDGTTFPVVRHEARFANGTPKRTIDLNYTSEKGILIPSKWEYMYLKGGVIQSHQTAETDSIEVNPEIRESDFEVNFPRGALVAEGDHPQSYWTIGKDGSKRPIPQALLAEFVKEGEVVLDRRLGNTSHLGGYILVNAVVILVIFGIFVYKRFFG